MAHEGVQCEGGAHIWSCLSFLLKSITLVQSFASSVELL